MSAPIDDTIVIVLAGGAGERLYPLTKERAKPAVFFGGGLQSGSFRCHVVVRRRSMRSFSSVILRSVGSG